MVERNELSNPRLAREFKRVKERTVPPPHTALIFLLRILRIVDEQVGVCGERIARSPFLAHWKILGAERGLMIGHVHDHRVRTTGRDPVAYRGVRMTDQLRGD